ncbi:MAG: glycosyltransferase, partial [Actinophytocola sp.]|nr:glycosyltransferase [Actinophytocola sp.]
ATIASAALSLAMARAYLAARKTADVVHVHVPNPWAVVLVLLFPPRGAIVVGAHAVSTRYGWLQAPHDWLMRALYRRSATIIASAKSNIRHLGLSEFQDNVQVMPYGISADRVGNGASSSAARPTVLFVGRLVYYKGLETLIDAAAHIEADIDVLGDGPLYGELAHRARTNGVADRVRFIRDADDDELRRR